MYIVKQQKSLNIKKLDKIMTASIKKNKKNTEYNRENKEMYSKRENSGFSAVFTQKNNIKLNLF